jgi:hypothetical protein
MLPSEPIPRSVSGYTFACVARMAHSIADFLRLSLAASIILRRG